MEIKAMGRMFSLYKTVSCSCIFIIGHVLVNKTIKNTKVLCVLLVCDHAFSLSSSLSKPTHYVAVHFEPNYMMMVDAIA